MSTATTDQLVILPELANAVWDVLVDCAHASNHEWQREAFVNYATGRTEISEYRFQGALGFGGKVRIGSEWQVTCYSEDANVRREAIIKRTNQALAELKASQQ